MPSDRPTELTHVTFQGPPIDDPEILDEIPKDLSHILRQINGFIQFSGGLHVRGACRQPGWHSLRRIWRGQEALHHRYPNVREADVPFAEDCMGDQFLLRDGAVYKLCGETGEVDRAANGLIEFFAKVEEDPLAYLALQPLADFYHDGGKLLPGQLLNVVPPFCISRDQDTQVSLRAIPADEQLAFLADFSRQIADVPDGGNIKFVIEPRE
jgi:hypothetical protein